MTVRTIIVGCGAVAQRLYRKPLVLLAKQKLVEVVGLVDPAREHADELLPAFPGAKHFTTLEEACRRSAPAIDAGVDAAAPALRADAMAFAHGSHVLCEKPMASSRPNACA